MISIELIRQNPDVVKEAMRKRDAEVPIDRILELDRIRRSIISETDTLRARRNEVSRQMGRSKERPQQLIEEMRSVGRRIRDLEDSLRDTDNELDSLMLKVPNIPDVTAPVGHDELANIEVKRVGDLPSFDFEPKAHWDIAEALGIIDFERGVRLAGSRFFVLKGNGAKLQRAVISFMIDMHVEQHSYTEVYLPYMVNRETVQASGHLPGFQEEMYHDEEDDLWMLPTAEAAITSLHRDEILSAEDLPLYYVAHTPCWRREKASAGRDTRGIMRVHQFDKVEMYKFVAPDESTRGTRIARSRRRGRGESAGNSLPSVGTRNRRHGDARGEGVRRRDVGAGRGQVAGSQLMLKLYRLPVAAWQGPLQDRARRAAKTRPHPERIGVGPTPRHNLHPGELPTGRRKRGDTGGTTSLYGLRPDRLKLYMPPGANQPLVTWINCQHQTFKSVRP